MGPPPGGRAARHRQPITRCLALSLPILCACLPGPGRADPTVRVEAVAGFDTNVTRAEGQAPATGPLSRVVVDLEDSGRPARDWRISARYQGGVRRFLGAAAIPCRGGTADPTGEDALFQRIDGGLEGRLVGRLTMGARLDVRDRTTRDPCHPRDFTHLRGTLPFGWSTGDYALRLAGVAERFHYKPDARYDATSGGARLHLGWSPGRWSLSTWGEWLQRSYRGAEADAPADRVLRIGGGVSYAGPALVALAYSYSANDSTREGGGYGRHGLTLTGTAPLPGALVLSGRISLVRILHDEALTLPDDQTLQDEGRSAVALRLERPLTGRWSVVAHGGWWGSPFATGPAYDRWLALGGLSFGNAP